MAEKKQTAVAVAGITEKQVRELITEALKGFVTEDQVKLLIVDVRDGFGTMITEAVTGLVGNERFNAFIVELDELISQKTGDATKDLINNEQLTALLQKVTEHIGEAFENRLKELQQTLFTATTGSLSSAVFADNEEVDLFDPTLLEGLEIDGEPMTTEDILSGVMNGGVVTLISRDGQKHTITRA